MCLYLLQEDLFLLLSFRGTHTQVLRTEKVSMCCQQEKKKKKKSTLSVPQTWAWQKVRKSVFQFRAVCWSTLVVFAFCCSPPLTCMWVCCLGQDLMQDANSSQRDSCQEGPGYYQANHWWSSLWSCCMTPHSMPVSPRILQTKTKWAGNCWQEFTNARAFLENREEMSDLYGSIEWREVIFLNPKIHVISQFPVPILIF